MMRTTLKRYTMVIAAALLAACGSDDKKTGTGPDEGGAVVGSFTATLAGDIAGPLAGLAGHASVAEGEDKGFVFAFDDTPAANSTTASLLFIRVNPEAPSVGVHDVVFLDPEMTEDDFVLMGAVTGADGTQWICVAESGSITVTSSSAARVRGSFTVAAVCTSNGENEDEVALSGNFDSRPGEVD